VLFRLDPGTFENTLAVAEAAHKLALANYDNLKAPTREERIAQLEQTLVEIDSRITDKKRDLERYRRLVEVDKSLPARQLEQVQTELEVLAAQRISAEARLREAKQGPTATELAIAQAQVAQAEAALKIARKDLDDTVIRALFSGVVTRRFKSPGDYITNMPPAEVIEIVSLDHLEVELRLPEAYYPLVKANETRIILRSSLLKSDLATTVSRVIADIDAAKGTFGIRIAVPSDKGLVPGAFISADISFENAIHDVIVPLRAVVTVEGKPSVFVAVNGQMSQRPVELGDRLTEGVVVKSGLEPGQKVLVGPADALKDKALLPEDLRGN
jgi:HlyD family secretion protein